MDVAIKGKPAGRIHFVLFTKQSPRAAENFRQLCTGAVQRCSKDAHILHAQWL
jgi:cyclophilin family peptidyl-prolyl cis-trans isomerase